MLLKHERYIIQRRGEFLVGKPFEDSAYCRFSNSPYDGWQCRDFNAAIKVAKELGGKVVIFNRLNGNIHGGWK